MSKYLERIQDALNAAPDDPAVDFDDLTEFIKDYRQAVAHLRHFAPSACSDAVDAGHVWVCICDRCRAYRFLVRVGGQ